VSSYSANGLARALGTDNHTVARWIRAGHLKGPDIYLIHEKDVRRFILGHPTDIDLRKVDQLWFLDLITNGLVCSA